MEKRDELEKEERTIFIVLAIIVLIAIGVLLTWYFTKDKKAEDKDSDTKTKTIETKKKKEEETEEDENVSYTVTTKEESNTPVVVLSSNVKANNEEVKIVDTAEVVETPTTPTETTPVEEIVAYDNSPLPLYFVGEKISFTGNILSVTKFPEQTVEGNYTIENNVISFSESGFYEIEIEGQEKPMRITVYSDKNELKGILNGLQTFVEDNGYYFGNDEYTKFNEEILAIMTNFDNYTFNEIREKLANFQSAFDALEQSMNTAQYTVDDLIDNKLEVANAILGENATIKHNHENITVNILNNNATLANVGDLALLIGSTLQDQIETISSITYKDETLTNKSSFEGEEIKEFAKKLLADLKLQGVSGSTTLDQLIDKKLENIEVHMIDGTTAIYNISFTGTASVKASVDEANITSISNDDIVLVDTATAQAVVETDVKNEETDEKVISNDIISEEEPGEEVTEPSTFVKEEEDGTGLVKEDQIQESQALDPNLEVKETTLN